MKKLFTLLALGLSLSMGATHAAEAPAAKTAQQTKMGTCNAEAKTKALKGDERKAFMKDCLSAKPADGAATAAATPAENPMCEKSAADKKLHGAAKKAHIKKCMADGAAPAAAAAASAPAGK
ncbi:MAG: phosphate starvation-inducible protein PsiF [Burkholderiales bacterium]|jgi:hypothetical protein|nr:phosphate starvation-inducible protein PsiF [Burkholderiales bacterium]MBP8053352.1 phosphate starvation-inducible protein PsiF [Burkholderiaceae bacterium]